MEQMMLGQQNAIFSNMQHIKENKLEEIYKQEEFKEPEGSRIYGKRAMESPKRNQERKKRFKTASELGLKL